MTSIDKLVSISEKSLTFPGKLSPLPKYTGNGPTLFVFRHGQTFDNLHRIFSGRRDSKLTPVGLLQAQQLAERLKTMLIDIAYTPDLSRCKKTLEIALKFHPRTRVFLANLLLERDYGDLTGKSKLKANRDNPVLTAKYRRAYDFPPPNGESLKNVKEKRIWPLCKKIEERIKNEKINIAVCCTNNTMRLIRMYFEKLTIDQMEELENPLGQDFCSYEITQFNP